MNTDTASSYRRSAPKLADTCRATPTAFRIHIEQARQAANSTKISIIATTDSRLDIVIILFDMTGAQKMAITGIITASEKIKGFDDASSLYEFQLDGDEEKFTCRTFDNARHPVAGDTVLVFLMTERNHASKVVFDADLNVTRKALS